MKMKTVKQYWPLWVALFVYVVGVGFFVWTSMSRCDGRVIYALDDAYIHLALGDTFGSTGTWGFTDGEFASASSAPLWSLLLSLLLLIFRSELWPLIINIITGFGLVFILDLFARKRGIASIPRALMLAGIVSFSSLVSLTMIGMEHLMHTLIFIVFIYYGAKSLDEDKGYGLLLLFAPLLGSIRYEGLFTIIAFSLLLIWKRKFIWALGILALGFLPITVLGLVSVQNGWPFFPSSLLTKTNFDFTGIRGILILFFKFAYQIATKPIIWPAFIFGSIPLLIMVRKRRFEGFDFYISVLFMLTLFAHMHLAKTKWLYRYEAYLIAGSFFVFFTTTDLKSIIEKRWVKNTVLVLVVVASMLLGKRFISNHGVLYYAQTNIYHQQYQTGLFLRKFYNDDLIFIHDIGAPLWLTNIKPLDVCGLATREFIENNTSHPQENKNEMLRLADERDVNIAVLYRKIVPSDDWIRCGSLVISNNYACASDSVIFLAVREEAAGTLKENFRAFVSELPPEIEVRY